MVGADDRAVYHLNLVRHRLAFIQRIEDQIPEPRDGPSTELSIDARPLTELFGQVAPLRTCPRDPENTIQNLPVIDGRTTAAPPNPDDKRLKECPLSIHHQLSCQSCLRQKATLNQNSDDLGIQFVNRTYSAVFDIACGIVTESL